MTITEIMWYAIAILGTVGLAVLIGVLIAIPMGAERRRRQDAAIDRDFEGRRAQFPDSALDAALDSALTGGRITPATLQRLIDAGWLEPRP